MPAAQGCLQSNSTKSIVRRIDSHDTVKADSPYSITSTVEVAAVAPVGGHSSASSTVTACASTLRYLFVQQCTGMSAILAAKLCNGPLTDRLFIDRALRRLCEVVFQDVLLQADDWMPHNTSASPARLRVCRQRQRTDCGMSSNSCCKAHCGVQNEEYQISK